MSEFDHINWESGRLQERLDELNKNDREIKYTGERKQQIDREIGLIALELACRYRDSHTFLPDDIKEVFERT